MATAAAIKTPVRIFAGDADLGVKDVTQHCGGHHRREEYAEQVPHPKLDRVHHAE